MEQRELNVIAAAVAADREPGEAGGASRPASWIDSRHEDLKVAMRRIRQRKHLTIAQPFFPFDGAVPDCDIIWANDQHFKTHPDFTCDIYFTQGYPDDFARLRYVRETGRAAVCATWFWDNHHLFATTMRAAMLSDVTFHAHDYVSDYIRNELALTGGFVPLCPIFWTRDVVLEGHRESLLAARSNQLYGGYNSYPEFPERDVCLNRLMEAIPDHRIFITKHGVPADQHPFYGMSPLARLQEWMQYKVSLCMSFGANMAIRIFDTLLAGGIPLVVGRPADLDAVISPALQTALPIMVIDSFEPRDVEAAHLACIQRFDSEGVDGVIRRAQYALENHMPANRMRTMIDRIRSLAEDFESFDDRLNREP